MYVGSVRASERARTRSGSAPSRHAPALYCRVGAGTSEFANKNALNTDTKQDCTVLSRPQMHDTNGHREPNAQVMLLLLLVVLVFAVPIRLIVPVPGPEFRRGLVCVMELLFVLPYTLSLARRENFVVLSPVAGALFAAWLIAAAVSVGLSPYPFPALARQAEWLCHITFAASLWHFLRNNRSYTRWALGFVIGGVCLTILIVFLAWLGDPDNATLHWRRYLPLFTHIRHFGYYVLAGLLLAQLWGADEHARSATVIITVPILAILWGALIWTGGRGAFVAAMIGLVATMALAPGRRWVMAGINTVAISVGSVIAVIMSAGRPELGWHRILSRVGGDVAGGFATGRLNFWSLAFENFAANPIFGLGPDAYRYMQPKIFGSHPHNVVLQFLTDYGVIGASMFGLMAVILLASILRRASDRRGDIRPERVVALSVLIAFLANSLLDGNLYHALPLMIVGATVAVGLLPESFSRVNGASAGLMAIRTGFTGATATALAVFFALYSVLLTNFVAGPIPSESSPRAQLVRNVPMVTHGMTLETWIRAWSIEDAEAAIEWAHWAHEHSPEAYRFSSLEAKLLMNEGLYEAAREHAEQALQSAGGRTRLAMTRSLQPIIDATESHSGQMLFQVDDD